MRNLIPLSLVAILTASAFAANGYRIQARSLDGGKTWKTEENVPFSHQEAKATRLPAPLDFTAPGFALIEDRTVRGTFWTPPAR